MRHPVTDRILYLKSSKAIETLLVTGNNGSHTIFRHIFVNRTKLYSLVNYKQNPMFYLNKSV